MPERSCSFQVRAAEIDGPDGMQSASWYGSSSLVHPAVNAAARASTKIGFEKYLRLSDMIDEPESTVTSALTVSADVDLEMAPRMDRSNRRTLAEVAERVGVSARTVSRVVNQEGGFSEETRRRVQEAIRELGYRPNLRARSLVTNSTNLIALVVTQITDPYFPDLAESVGASLAKQGRTMTLALNHDDPDEQQVLVDVMISQGVDGIIAAPAASDLEPFVEAADLGIPVVILDHEVAHPGMASVSNDIAGGARAATEYLIGQGHEHIGMISNVRTLGGLHSRREGAFKETMSASGLEATRISYGSPNLDGGRSSAMELLQRHPDTTAVFAYNDMMAVGLIQAAVALGRTIPDDLAVVGFDDIDIAAITTPPLTTVHLDRDKLGTNASEVLNQMIAGEDGPHRRPDSD